MGTFVTLMPRGQLYIASRMRGRRSRVNKERPASGRLVRRVSAGAHQTVGTSRLEAALPAAFKLFERG